MKNKKGYIIKKTLDGYEIPYYSKIKLNKMTKETVTLRIAAYQNGIPPGRSGFNVNNSFEGETIEQRVAKILNNNEPIKDGAPQIYTERKEGVIPEYNIRTDRFDQAIEMTSIISQREISKRLERHAPKPIEPTGSPAPGPVIPTKIEGGTPNT